MTKVMLTTSNTRHSLLSITTLPQRSRRTSHSSLRSRQCLNTRLIANICGLTEVDIHICTDTRIIMCVRQPDTFLVVVYTTCLHAPRARAYTMNSSMVLVSSDCNTFRLQFQHFLNLTGFFLLFHKTLHPPSLFLYFSFCDTPSRFPN